MCHSLSRSSNMWRSIRRIAAVLLLLVIPAGVHAQRDVELDSVTRLIDRGIMAPSDVAFDAALALLDRLVRSHPGSLTLQHHRGHALFRKGSVIATDRQRRDEAKELLRHADQALEASEPLRWPETPALRASVAGQLIGMGNPIAAVSQMRRASREMRAAAALGPENPRVWLMHGIASYFKPGFVGGGRDAAARDLRRAIALFDAKPNEPRRPTWGRAEAHAWLGRVLASTHREDSARMAYQTALAINPDFEWVRDHLIPELDAQVAAARQERDRQRARSSAVSNPDMSRRK